jgi:predicted RNA-binding protein with PUA-like domain
MNPGCWLLKSEPDVFSIEDLRRQPGGTEPWNGVRNYQARNYLRQMRIGDQICFYHSSCQPPGIAGLARIVRAAYPDHTALDPRDPYHDPRATAGNNPWSMVDVRWEATFPRLITLETLRAQPELASWPLVKRGNRLSVLPVSAEQWRCIMHLAAACP